MRRLNEYGADFYSAKFPVKILKTVIVTTLFFHIFFGRERLFSQDVNPPFPRIGQVTFYNPGVGPLIWKDHDLIIIRFKYTNAARNIKDINPNAILLATNDQLVNDCDEFPNDWYVHDSQTGEKLELWTNGCLLNHTKSEVRSWVVDKLVDNTDYSVFDGTMFDYWSYAIWADQSNPLNSQWKEANRLLVELFRSRNNKPILAHESDDDEVYLNGKAFEFWGQASANDQASARAWLMDQAIRILNTATEPRFLYANSEAGTREGTGLGPVFRADFTSAQIVGAFFGHDEGTSAHRWTFLHDEYEADLGYPTSPPQELEEGLWVRYFDKGVMISNVSGKSKSVSASSLSGGPYWRFQGQQDPNFNNGQQFNGVTFQPFDGIMLFKQPTTLVTPIVIDNVAKNMTSLGQQPVQYSGSWTQVKWDDTSGDFAYSLGYGWDEFAPPYDVTTGNGSAVYQFSIGVSGKYEIFEWHPNLQADGQGTPCSNVEAVISSADGTDTKSINQGSNYGRWNSLGVYNFNKGNSGNIVLNAPGGCTTASDAIRLFFGEGGEPTNGDTVPPNPPKGVEVQQNN